MRKLIAMRSFPGAGKSFHAEKMIKEHLEYCSEDATIHSADAFFKQLGRYDASMISEAHAQCFSGAISACHRKDELIVIDNTNLQVWEISPYALMANAFRYEFEIVQVECDPEKAFARQVHGVPKKAHDDMVRAYRNVRLLPWWKVSTIKSD